MFLTERDGEIARLVVRYERGHASSE
jgi:hypothetical protein